MLISNDYPSYIKYMGSKSKIIDFVVDGINEVRDPGQPVLDLFSGSASLAGAVGQQTDFYSNDIQIYSGILADAYTKAWNAPGTPNSRDIINRAEAEVGRASETIQDFLPLYSRDMNLETFVSYEEKQRELIDKNFNHDWHLFLKNYSGTWWSAYQCLWIDAIRKEIENYREHPVYPVLMSSLMFAMAYCSQGTGHYAQYRDAKTISSMKDISIYRFREISQYFSRKYNEAVSLLSKKPPTNISLSSSLDFTESLNEFEGGVIYADPPYCFVHYSRFYHALETLVLYDYPELQVKGGKTVKGRYRVDRHQSPFSIRSKVSGAFQELFRGVLETDSKLVLSYSNTGMISLEELSDIANTIFRGRNMELLSMDYQHMTLGRQGIRHRDVKECLLLVK
ncbi:DNA adenine methylase [Vreelandella piezotolerans]|uniref:DNA adenine methylase n=1 Tax=Vreelandella piezotolerans TaxID=2609667 RepID=UPI001C635FC8|nr:DNA adenine methylase [Halomonas piezotolerans]